MNAARLPVPVRMKLPSSDWRMIDPEILSMESAGMVAIRTTEPGGYVPILTVDGTVRVGEPSLESFADEVVSSLSDQFDHAELVKRRIDDTETSVSTLHQLIAIEEQRSGRRYDLQQAHVIQEIRDALDPQRQIILSYTMTNEFRFSAQLRDEFSGFMESVEVLPVKTNS